MTRFLILPNHIFGNSETRHFKFCSLLDTQESVFYTDTLGFFEGGNSQHWGKMFMPPNGILTESFTEIVPGEPLCRWISTQEGSQI